jgi:hypothetical protein
MNPYEAWIYKGAQRASKTAKTRAARTFFEALAHSMEATEPRSVGNRKFIEKAIGIALTRVLKAVAKPGWTVRGSHDVHLAGVPRLKKEIDAGVFTKRGAFLIERKTIFRNNAFFETAYEGWLLRRGFKTRHQFVGLFHHFHGTLDRYHSLVADAAKNDMIGGAYLLVKDEESVAKGDAAIYDTREIDRLLEDVAAFVD